MSNLQSVNINFNFHASLLQVGVLLILIGAFTYCWYKGMMK